MQLPRLSVLEVQDRADRAARVLDNEFVREIFKSLKEEYLNEMIAAKVGSEEASIAHSKAKVIDDFQARLQSLITDYKMRLKSTHRSDDNG